ncbi:MAG: recombination protein RecR [Proteobacteria bacterium]|nr:recombination protein RecR [Pseudomonadota bacterium]
MKLPTIGPKSAARLAFHIVGASAEDARRLSQAIVEVKERIRPCRRCHNLAENELCPVCADPLRDGSVVCVVADPRDVVAIERAREYRGTYHVLGGLISPMDGVGPDQLHVSSLLERLREGEVREIILAMDANVSGETTSLYLVRVLRPQGVRVTRLAYGLPHGMNLEFADEVTLARSLQGRREAD